MSDLIDRHGTAAWLENMGYPNLANMVLDKKRFPPAEPKAIINLDVMEVSKEALDKFKTNCINVPVTAFPVQPERKRGKWIDSGYNEEWWAREYRCSECGDAMLGEANFCPNCGADMREVTSIPSECEGDCGWCKPSVIEECKGVTE